MFAHFVEVPDLLCTQRARIEGYFIEPTVESRPPRSVATQCQRGICTANLRGGGAVVLGLAVYVKGERIFRSSNGNVIPGIGWIDLSLRTETPPGDD